MSELLKRLIGVGVIGVGAGLAMAQATQPGNEYHASGYPETYQGAFYPGTELRALPGARAQASASAAEFRRAQQDLDNAIDDIRRQFSRSPDFIAAQFEEKAAYDELLSIRNQVIVRLKDDPSYQAAVDLRNRLGDQILTAREDKQTTIDQLLAMATVKLSYSSTATAMEAAAITADPRFEPARQRLLTAGNRLALLNQQFDEAVRRSPMVLAERKHVQDARIAAVASDALYVEATNVANVALDYAYHLYDQPYPYVNNGSYYGSYYGYGSYGTGYQVGYPIGYPNGWGGHGRRR